MRGVLWMYTSTGIIYPYLRPLQKKKKNSIYRKTKLENFKNFSNFDVLFFTLTLFDSAAKPLMADIIPKRITTNNIIVPFFSISLLSFTFLEKKNWDFQFGWWENMLPRNVWILKAKALLFVWWLSLGCPYAIFIGFFG